LTARNCETSAQTTKQIRTRYSFVEAVPDTVVVAVVVTRVDREDDAVDDDDKLLLRFEPVGDEVAEPVVDMLHDAVCDAEDDTDDVELEVRVPAATLPLTKIVALTDGVAVGVRLSSLEAEVVPELVEDRSEDVDIVGQTDAVLDAVPEPESESSGEAELDPV
jgi:hypothetical protein